MALPAIAVGVDNDQTLRIMPRNWVAPEGEFVLCLGHDSPGRKERMAVGDFVQLGQTGDFDTTTIFRIQSRIRAPVSMPGDTYWEVSIVIDGTKHTARKLEAGRTRDLMDMSANVSNLAPGNHALAFRIELVGTAGVYDDVELPAWYIDALSFEGGDTFTPFGLGDLASWWEADFTFVTTGADINSVSTIGSLADGFSTDASEEPDLTTLLAKDAVLFDGSNDKLETDSAGAKFAFLHNGTGMTVCCVVHPTAAADQTIFSSFDNVIGEIGLSIRRLSGGEVELQVGNGSGVDWVVNAATSAAGVLPISTTKIITLRMESGRTDEYEVRVNGVVVLNGTFSGSPSGSVSTGPLGIGDAPSGGDAWTGYVNAWTAYDAWKADSEVEALEDYLTRWP